MKAPQTTAPQPPANLTGPARTLWQTVARDYGIEDSAGLIILTAAAEAFARLKQAQEVVAREGLLTEDRYGIKKPHPCVAIERDARGQLLAALKQLNLDLEPLRQSIGRPPGSSTKFRTV